MHRSQYATDITGVILISVHFDLNWKGCFRFLFPIFIFHALGTIYQLKHKTRAKTEITLSSEQRVRFSDFRSALSLYSKEFRKKFKKEKGKCLRFSAGQNTLKEPQLSHCPYHYSPVERNWFLLWRKSVKCFVLFAEAAGTGLGLTLAFAFLCSQPPHPKGSWLLCWGELKGFPTTNHSHGMTVTLQTAFKSPVT